MLMYAIILLDGRIIMEKKKTCTTTIRIPIEVRQRIDVLAHKRMCSINAWIARTLDRESRPRNAKGNIDV